jgi:hypothetical protein
MDDDEDIDIFDMSRYGKPISLEERLINWYVEAATYSVDDKIFGDFLAKNNFRAGDIQNYITNIFVKFPTNSLLVNVPKNVWKWVLYIAKPITNTIMRNNQVVQVSKTLVAPTITQLSVLIEETQSRDRKEIYEITQKVLSNDKKLVNEISTTINSTNENDIIKEIARRLFDFAKQIYIDRPFLKNLKIQNELYSFVLKKDTARVPDEDILNLRDHLFQTYKRRFNTTSLKYWFAEFESLRQLQKSIFGIAPDIKDYIIRRIDGSYTPLTKETLRNVSSLRQDFIFNQDEVNGVPMLQWYKFTPSGPYHKWLRFREVALEHH